MSSETETKSCALCSQPATKGDLCECHFLLKPVNDPRELIVVPPKPVIINRCSGCPREAAPYRRSCQRCLDTARARRNRQHNPLSEEQEADERQQLKRIKTGATVIDLEADLPAPDPLPSSSPTPTPLPLPLPSSSPAPSPPTPSSSSPAPTPLPLPWSPPSHRPPSVPSSSLSLSLSSSSSNPPAYREPPVQVILDEIHKLRNDLGAVLSKTTAPQVFAPPKVCCTHPPPSSSSAPPAPAPSASSSSSAPTAPPPSGQSTPDQTSYSLQLIPVRPILSQQIQSRAYARAIGITAPIPPAVSPNPRFTTCDRTRLHIKQELLPLPPIPAPSTLQFIPRTTTRNCPRHFDDPVDFHMAAPLFYVLLSRHSSTDQTSRQLLIDLSANIATPSEQALKPSIILGSRTLLCTLAAILRGNGQPVALPRFHMYAQPLPTQMVDPTVLELIDTLFFAVRSLPRVPLDSFESVMFMFSPKTFHNFFKAMLFYAMLTD